MLDLLHTPLTVLHIFVCLMLMLVVLIQPGKSGGLGAALGGAGAQQIFGGRGAGNFLTRTTWIAASIFFLTSVTLAYLSTSTGDSLEDLANTPVLAPAGPTPVDTLPAGSASPAPASAPSSPAPRDRLVRAGVVDRDLGALAGQQLGDVDLAAPGGSDPVARVVELGRGDLAPVALHRIPGHYHEMSSGGPLVVAALSGGVDSATAAALLVEAGHRVVGMTMRLYDARGTAASSGERAPTGVFRAPHLTSGPRPGLVFGGRRRRGRDRRGSRAQRRMAAELRTANDHAATAHGVGHALAQR